jgi:hypothetical protein
MKPGLQTLSFDGAILQRGFWLYIWEITPTGAAPLYYVGRTGDSSSTHAQSPFNRMGQHLGFKEASNALRRRLLAKGVTPEACHFKLVAVGPLDAESTEDTRAEHDERRDRIAAMEKALADQMLESGYNVINRVHCKKKLHLQVFDGVRLAFSGAFPKLREGVEPARAESAAHSAAGSSADLLQTQSP